MLLGRPRKSKSSVSFRATPLRFRIGDTAARTRPPFDRHDSFCRVQSPLGCSVGGHADVVRVNVLVISRKRWTSHFRLGRLSLWFCCGMLCLKHDIMILDVNREASCLCHCFGRLKQAPSVATLNAAQGAKHLARPTDRDHDVLRSFKGASRRQATALRATVCALSLFGTS